MTEAEQDEQHPHYIEIDEEQEWEAIVRKPHVRNALRRLAREALRQDSLGETEEGGFVVE